MTKKMIMAVIPRDQASHVLEMLITAGYPVTFTESRGGVWRQAQSTLYLCIDDTAVEGALSIIRANCRARVEVEAESIEASTSAPTSIQLMAELGGAVVFVWDVARMEMY